MIHRSSLLSARNGLRAGYTLVEILVVIAIIVIVIALTASTVIRVITVQQINNTRTSLTKIQSALDKQIIAVKDAAISEKIQPSVQSVIQASLAGSKDASGMDRVKVIYVKLRVQQMFPETFDEVFSPSVFPTPVGSYVKYLNQYGINASLVNSMPNPSTPGGKFQYQSAVCLAMALQLAVSSGGVSMEDLGRGATLANVPIDPSQSITAPMLLDAWGTPICYSRFPAGCTTRNPSGAIADSVDPLDPRGALMSPNWPPCSLDATPCRTTYSAVVLQRLAPAGSSFNLWPIVASAGPDRNFDLWMNPASNPTNPNSGFFDFSEVGPGASDNLYPAP